MSRSSPENPSPPRVAPGPTGAKAWLPGLLLLTAACGPGPTPRSVVLISLDTTRADALGFDDRFVTPRLTELAERGTNFRQAISGSSWTLPAHAQMFTGQPPELHGVEDDNVRIAQSTPTLPELMGQAGFLGYGIFTGWYLLSDYGFGRGFEIYANGMPGGDQLEAQLRNNLSANQGASAMNVWEVADQQSHRVITSPGVVQFAGEALKDVGEEDLFLFTHLFDPHYDYVPPVPYDTRFDPDYQGDMTGENFYLNKLVFDVEKGGRQISDRDLEHVIALYMGELAWTDEHVGQIVDLLRSSGRLDDAWIVVTADHGEEFFEHGGRGHRHTLFEEQIRVPLLVVPPMGQYPDAPREAHMQVSLSDLLPTLCEAFDLAVPDTAFGRSLLPVLAGETLDDVPQLSSLRARPRVSKTGGETKHLIQEAFRTPEEKLIRRVIWKGTQPTLLETSWYDLTADPFEQSPVRDTADPRLRKAWGQLEAQRNLIRQALAAGPQTPIGQRLTKAREMMSANLVALGYLEEGEELSDDLPAWGLGPSPELDLP